MKHLYSLISGVAILGTAVLFSSCQKEKEYVCKCDAVTGTAAGVKTTTSRVIITKKRQKDADEECKTYEFTNTQTMTTCALELNK